MPNRLHISEFLNVADQCLVVDVRSPGEFAQGHIAGAVSCPLFSDEQRALVGTAYKQQGRLPAVMLGLELVGPKMRGLAEQVHALLLKHEVDASTMSADSETESSLERVLVHCWRGGMRSSSVCWLLEQTGLSTSVLVGGYKAYRRAAHEAFALGRNIAVLSGMTGAGKTRLLHRLRLAGEQVLDLEGLAHHRGSSFGAIDLPPQPTCEQFENRIYTELRKLDPSRTIWIEDESPSIGKVRVPQSLWWHMREATAFYLDVDRTSRAKNLADEYGKLCRSELVDATTRLEKKLGSVVVREILRDLQNGDDESAAFRLLAYYDKTYQHAAKRRPRKQVVRVDGEVSPDELIERNAGLRSIA